MPREGVDGGKDLPPKGGGPGAARERYARMMESHAGDFAAGKILGVEMVEERARAVDALVLATWAEVLEGATGLGDAVALLAVGGFGRRELFPYSDVDLLLVVADAAEEAGAKAAIRRLGQAMWDTGLRFSPVVRRMSDLDRMEMSNLEFAMAVLDRRVLGGDAAMGVEATERLRRATERQSRELAKGLGELTRARHAKFGDTPFHLEPNVKEGPGGLRDVQVVRWLRALGVVGDGVDAASELEQSAEFLTEVRAFLHLRHGRDNNVLDWGMQDEAAEQRIGLRAEESAAAVVDAAFWMRSYFRRARAVGREMEAATVEARQRRPGVGRAIRGLGPRRRSRVWPQGFEVREGRVAAVSDGGGRAAVADAEAVLALFGAVAELGQVPTAALEAELEGNLPLLAARLGDGAATWAALRSVLLGRHAGAALRSMHAVGLLDLLVPEFHGIDALVIRDAYHRYTVDEHTFVAIDVLHALPGMQTEAGDGWEARLTELLRELEKPELLYLAVLMHDTGKGRSTGEHTVESARLTEALLERLDLPEQDRAAVIALVTNHLEMSATLRRDIFQTETVKGFAGLVRTPEMLRQLTLFTYADLCAVHPDALTAWKVENLVRLYMLTANQLSRNVGEERVATGDRALLERLRRAAPGSETAIAAYLAGFPERYVRTRSAEEMAEHFRLAKELATDGVQIQFRYGATLSEVVLVTRDRSSLFADLAGVLAAWGMNIVTADAFANGQGIVVDTFRFTDRFRTLELNPSERDRFVGSIRDVVQGRESVERLLQGRRPSTKRLLEGATEPRLTVQQTEAAHATLLEVVVADSPGLLRTLSLAIAEQGCNIEVALVDTEGETAIDVFYLTRGGRPLDENEAEALTTALWEATARAAG